MRRDLLLGRGRLAQPLGPVGLDERGVAGEGPRPSVHALDQPVGGQPLQVAVDGDGRDAVLAGELGHRRPAGAVDAVEDLGAAELGRH